MRVKNPTTESMHFPKLHKTFKYSAIKISLEHVGGAKRPLMC